MAFIDIVAIIVLLAYAFMGAAKGFIKSVTGLISIAVAVLVASLIGGVVGGLIASSPSGTGANLGADLAVSIEEFLSSKGEIFTMVPPGGYTEGVIIDALLGAGIPAFIGSLVAGPISVALVGVSGVSLSEAVAPVLSNLAFSAIGFVIVLVIVWALLLVLCKKIKKFLDSFTLLKTADVLLGLGFGIIRGGITICIPITIISALNFIPGFGEFISNSVIVSWIADNNFITAILSSGFNVGEIVNEALRVVGAN